MKQLFFYLFLSLSLFSNAQYISKINVFHIQKGGFHFIGINEGNIRASATTKFTITDTDCLNRVDSLLQQGEELKPTIAIGKIYMLCEIIYSYGERKILLFEDSKNGILKLGSKSFKNIFGLEGAIIFCRQKSDSL